MYSQLQRVYRRIFPRLMFQVIGRYLPRKRKLSILDIGCGNHSPTLFKMYFPACTYTGLDRVPDYNLLPEDRANMDHFILMDLTAADWTQIPDNAYDLITMAHVIEHIPNGEEVITHLWQKLKPGGYLYIETPREKSLFLPSMPGTLNFFDDPTHVRLYTPVEIANHLLQLNAEVVRMRVARNWRRLIFMPVLLVLHLIFKGTIRRGALWWDLTGFAYYVLARKPMKGA
ncbi:MAG: class I SAM-dependent methyltransferase [Bacteroidia bacterium]|nr:class I SAM-dependent methyltransferase [Bacteroidia bacterium]MCX7764746.1 class I SAM-dependent methyltransferase [Bacteroidia bacterium]MDW8058157.1 class I SAM-dependent methyltransferase [Bacteroidia bacterium]